MLALAELLLDAYLNKLNAIALDHLEHGLLGLHLQVGAAEVMEQRLILVRDQELKWQVKGMEVVDNVPIDLDILGSKCVHVPLLHCLVIQINHQVLLD